VAGKTSEQVNTRPEAKTAEDINNEAGPLSSAPHSNSTWQFNCLPENSRTWEQNLLVRKISAWQRSASVSLCVKRRKHISTGLLCIPENKHTLKEEGGGFETRWDDFFLSLHLILLILGVCILLRVWVQVTGVFISVYATSLSQINFTTYTATCFVIWPSSSRNILLDRITVACVRSGNGVSISVYVTSLS
jgi:hypothetical protein